MVTIVIEKVIFVNVSICIALFLLQFISHFTLFFGSHKFKNISRIPNIAGLGKMILGEVIAPIYLILDTVKLLT